jgi:hypothetical protein
MVFLSGGVRRRSAPGYFTDTPVSLYARTFAFMPDALVGM